MKRVLFTFSMIIMLVSSMFAQTYVSTLESYKNAVLEEYTGFHCPYCPEGHVIAKQIMEDNPYRVVLINVHAGSFAIPGVGEPDYRTEFGEPLADLSELTGYPSGTVNRHLFSSTETATALSRGSWEGAVETIMQDISPVNVGVSSNYNEATRELTIDVELYYTSNSPELKNYLNVALLQNKIIGPQRSGSSSITNYEHNHMLRDLITGQWGAEITTTTAGTFIQKQYVYTVPADFLGVECVVENCEIAVFVSETHQEIYSGAVVEAIGGNTLVTSSFTNISDFILKGQPDANSEFTFDVNNYLSENSQFTVTLTKIDEPEDWTSSFTIANTTGESVTVSLKKDINLASLNVTPGTSAGVATYILTIQSLEHPENAPVSQKFYVYANIEDLILNNAGEWDGGSPEDFVIHYAEGMTLAGSEQLARMNMTQFLLAAAKNPIDFNTIFFNVGWTSPSVTADIVNYFTTYLDNGGKLFLAGQDIGWEVWSEDYGNATTQDFFTKYLHADYKNDGDETNKLATPNAADPIFGTIQSSDILPIYGADNMYPDEISPLGEAVSVFFYNNDIDKSSAVRYEDADKGYKVVYFGFDPSMAKNQATRVEIIRRSYLWLTGQAMTSTAVILPNIFSTVDNMKPTITVNFSDAVRNIDNSQITEADIKQAITIGDAAGKANLDYTATINAENNIVTITLLDYLENSWGYNIDLAGDKFENNSDVAITTVSSFFITEGKTPTITSTPIDLSINVELTQSIKLFSDLKLTKLNGSTIVNSDVVNLITFTDAAATNVPFTGSISLTKAQFNITPAGLMYNTTYYITLHDVRSEKGVKVPTTTISFTTKEDPNSIQNVATNNVKIYPNPAKDYINVVAQKDANVVIYNLSGQILYNNTLESDNVTINTANYRAGIYIVKVINGTSVSEHKIVIK